MVNGTAQIILIIVVDIDTLWTSSGAPRPLSTASSLSEYHYHHHQTRPNRHHSRHRMTAILETCFSMVWKSVEEDVIMCQEGKTIEDGPSLTSPYFVTDVKTQIVAFNKFSCEKEAPLDNMPSS
jgi:hypothetical protein